MTTKINNVLTDHINKIAFEALSEISVDTLYKEQHIHPYYWFVAIKRYWLNQILAR